MIDRDEIEERGNTLGVSAANVQRDYVFGWLLKALYENAYLAPILVFKGGNCMRKAYYPDTRFSVDLDFSVTERIDAARFQEAINESCNAARDVCGVIFETARNTFAAEHMIDAQRQSFKGKVYFRDFYGNEGAVTIAVRLDVTEFDKIFLPTVSRDLIHPYSDGAACQARLQCMAIEELLANKLKCLLQRRHSYDLYDFVYATFFENAIAIDRSVVLRTFLRKTIYERSPGSAKQLLLGLPIALFKGAWEKYLVCPMQSRFDFDQIPDVFARMIEAIFGDSRAFGWGPEPFFPANLRNQIMEAGSGRRIIRLRYDGTERLVEPYSLAYKRRKDGEANEYLYVFDRTGGISSEPGIRSFFHHKIESLVVTEDEFEPRFPIEISKAGELSKNEYFGKPFSDSRTAGPRSVRNQKRTRIARNPFAQSYTVKCPYCSKTFKRSNASTILHPHKDKHGFRCTARQGYFV